jgi:hypothetical protein
MCLTPIVYAHAMQDKRVTEVLTQNKGVRYDEPGKKENDVEFNGRGAR